MSKHAIFKIKTNDKLYCHYIHGDGYIEYFGNKLVKIFKKLFENKTPKEINEFCIDFKEYLNNNILFVDEEKEFTEDEYKKYNQYSDLSVDSGKSYYCLFRRIQGEQSIELLFNKNIDIFVICENYASSKYEYEIDLENLQLNFGKYGKIVKSINFEELKNFEDITYLKTFYKD